MATDYTRFTEIAQVFTPGAPVRRLELFAGRRTQLLDLASVIGHPGQHAVIYGERGVGKTSLANIISEAIRESSNVSFWRVTCSRADTFESIWARLLKEYTDETLYGDTVPGPDKVRLILQRQGLLVVVLDELDQIDDPTTMAHMADTVKALSDHAVDTTLIFVGVADSIDELIEEHESVERALMQIQMPRMSPPELVEAIDKRLEVLSMTMTDDAKRRIAILSEGLPYYTHTLALYAAQEAAADHRDAVTLLDVGNATKKAVEKAQHSIRGAYLGAVGSPRKGDPVPAGHACMRFGAEERARLLPASRHSKADVDHAWQTDGDFGVRAAPRQTHPRKPRRRPREERPAVALDVPLHQPASSAIRHPARP